MKPHKFETAVLYLSTQYNCSYYELLHICRENARFENIAQDTDTNLLIERLLCYQQVSMFLLGQSPV